MDYINYINNAKTDEEFIKLFQLDSPYKDYKIDWKLIKSDSKYYNYLKGIRERWFHKFNNFNERQHKLSIFYLKKYPSLNIKLNHLAYSYGYDEYFKPNKFLYYYIKETIYATKHNLMIGLFRKRFNFKKHLYICFIVKDFGAIPSIHWCNKESIISKYFILYFILKK